MAMLRSFTSLQNILMSGRPRFVSQLGQKYVCAKCKEVLFPPIKQTVCGHLICENPCAEELFRDTTEAICPGNTSDDEEEECKPLTKNQLNPDIAIQRELLNHQVYCNFEVHGCKETMKWLQLSRHLENCEFRDVNCKYPGCNDVLIYSKKKEHEAICEFRTIYCNFCKLNIPKIDFAKGHTALCSRNNLRRSDKIEILRDLREHVVKQGDEMNSLRSNNYKLTSSVETLQTIVDELSENFNLLVKKEESNNAMKKETNLVNIQAATRIRESKLRRLEGAVEPDTKEDVRRIDRTLKSHIVTETEIRRILGAPDYSGTLIWKITNFTRRRQDALHGRAISLYSQPFYTSYYGYKMCARIYLNGDGLGKGTHISLFFVVMKGEYDALQKWPFQQKITLSVLDPSGKRRHITNSFRPDPTSTSFKRPTADMNIASGNPFFAKLDVIESDYVAEDTMFVRVDVETTGIKLPWD